jgi:hypothetical protein
VLQASAISLLTRALLFATGLLRFGESEEVTRAQKSFHHVANFSLKVCLMTDEDKTISTFEEVRKR